MRRQVKRVLTQTRDFTCPKHSAVPDSFDRANILTLYTQHHSFPSIRCSRAGRSIGSTAYNYQPYRAVHSFKIYTDDLAQWCHPPALSTILKEGINGTTQVKRKVNTQVALTQAGNIGKKLQLELTKGNRNKSLRNHKLLRMLKRLHWLLPSRREMFKQPAPRRLQRYPRLLLLSTSILLLPRILALGLLLS